LLLGETCGAWRLILQHLIPTRSIFSFSLPHSPFVTLFPHSVPVSSRVCSLPLPVLHLFDLLSGDERLHVGRYYLHTSSGRRHQVHHHNEIRLPQDLCPTLRWSLRRDCKHCLCDRPPRIFVTRAVCRQRCLIRRSGFDKHKMSCSRYCP
jgi:hypothetical protein